MFLREILKKKWLFLEVCKEDGESPFLEWYGQLNKKYKGTVKRLLGIIDQAADTAVGPTLFPTDISHEVDKKNSIYEFIAGDLRLLWFYSPCERKVIVCGAYHIKKGIKINKIELEKIVRIKKLYEQAYPAKQIVYFDEKGEKYE